MPNATAPFFGLEMAPGCVERVAGLHAQGYRVEPVSQSECSTLHHTSPAPPVCLFYLIGLSALFFTAPYFRHCSVLAITQRSVVIAGTRYVNPDYPTPPCRKCEHVPPTHPPTPTCTCTCNALADTMLTDTILTNQNGRYCRTTHTRTRAHAHAHAHAHAGDRGHFGHNDGRSPPTVG